MVKIAGNYIRPETLTSRVLGGATGVEICTQPEGAKNATVFQIGGCIITPEARLLPSKATGGRSGKMMYHSRDDFDGTAGPECGDKDGRRLCNGHPMPRAEFIEFYCNGQEPPIIA